MVIELSYKLFEIIEAQRFLLSSKMRKSNLQNSAVNLQLCCERYNLVKKIPQSVHEKAAWVRDPEIKHATLLHLLFCCKVFGPVLQGLNHMIASLSLDSDTFREPLSVLVELCEIKSDARNCRPICSLVSYSIWCMSVFCMCA